MLLNRIPPGSCYCLDRLRSLVPVGHQEDIVRAPEGLFTKFENVFIVLKRKRMTFDSFSGVVIDI